jgi:hypothetical protein
MIASSSWTSISFHLHGREETRESGGEINEKWRREWKEEGARGYPIRLEGKGEREEKREEKFHRSAQLSSLVHSSVAAMMICSTSPQTLIQTSFFFFFFFHKKQTI